MRLDKQGQVILDVKAIIKSLDLILAKGFYSVLFSR